MIFKIINGVSLEVIEELKVFQLQGHTVKDSIVRKDNGDICLLRQYVYRSGDGYITHSNLFDEKWLYNEMVKLWRDERIKNILLKRNDEVISLIKRHKRISKLNHLKI